MPNNRKPQRDRRQQDIRVDLVSKFDAEDNEYFRGTVQIGPFTMDVFVDLNDEGEGARLRLVPTEARETRNRPQLQRRDTPAPTPEILLLEIRRIHDMFTPAGGFVGKEYFLRRWRSPRLPSDLAEREHLLNECLSADLVALETRENQNQQVEALVLTPSGWDVVNSTTAPA